MGSEDLPGYANNVQLDEEPCRSIVVCLHLQRPTRSLNQAILLLIITVEIISLNSLKYFYSNQDILR